MDGPDIIVRTIEKVFTTDKIGNAWQYNPWSDHHSKVACWAIAFELLQHSSVLRRQVKQGKIVFGVNHKMIDFTTTREKKLDLVIARPQSAIDPKNKSLLELADQWQVNLTSAQKTRLAKLPDTYTGEVGSVLVALEAKACMTAHTRALPRLYDELTSSHLTVHGASNQALAVGFAMINASTAFISPKLNRLPLATNPPVVSTHQQPAAAERVLKKVSEIPRRSGAGGGQVGFDALGVLVIDMKNDGGAVTIPPHPSAGSFDYTGMLYRLVHEYENSFRHI